MKPHRFAILLLVTTSACTSAPKPGHYDGFMSSVRAPKDPAENAAADKTPFVQEGSFTITQIDASHFDVATSFYLGIQLQCTLHATLEKKSLVIPATDCVAEESGPGRPGGPGTKIQKNYSLSGRIDPGKSSDVSMALTIVGPKATIVMTLDATLEK